MAFEFIIAVVLILAIVFYIINYLNTGVFVFSREAQLNDLESKAVQASNLLLYNPGVWASGQPKQLGLELSWPVLNSTKLNDLQNYCNTNYDDLLEKLDLSGKKTRIIVDETTGQNIVLCGPDLPRAVLNVNVKRFALSESNRPLILNLWVW